MQNKTKPSAGALRANLIEAIRRDILNMGSIYRSVGDALAERETGVKELIEALELAEAVCCDLFEDLKAYGDDSRREQVTATCNRAQKLLSKHRGEKES